MPRMGLLVDAPVAHGLPCRRRLQSPILLTGPRLPGSSRNGAEPLSSIAFQGYSNRLLSPGDVGGDGASTRGAAPLINAARGDWFLRRPHRHICPDGLIVATYGSSRRRPCGARFTVPSATSVADPAYRPTVAWFVQEWGRAVSSIAFQGYSNRLPIARRRRGRRRADRGVGPTNKRARDDWFLRRPHRHICPDGLIVATYGSSRRRPCGARFTVPSATSVADPAYRPTVAGGP